MRITEETLAATKAMAKAEYDAGYDEQPTVWQFIADQFPSGGHWNTYAFTGQILGDAYLMPVGMKEFFYSLTNETTVTSCVMSPRVMAGVEPSAKQNENLRALGRESKSHPDRMLAATLVLGSVGEPRRVAAPVQSAVEYVANPQHPLYTPQAIVGDGTRQWLCYDGLPFFSTDHRVIPDLPTYGTYSNLRRGMPLNLENQFAVIDVMRAYRGTNNEPLCLSPNLLVVPPQLADVARDIQEQILGKCRLAVVVLAPLDVEPTAWYVMATQHGVKPLMYQVRQEPEAAFLDHADDVGSMPMEHQLAEWNSLAEIDPATLGAVGRADYLAKSPRLRVRRRDAVGYTLPFLAHKAIG